MGVVNVTPDSFSDGGAFLRPADAVKQALALAAEGADLIDVGAESSRPGAESIDEQEELRRLLPVLKDLRHEIHLPISIDTTKARVAEQALDLGASLINDISALRWDDRMGQVIARADAAVVLMHMHRTPKDMQHQPQYDDVVRDIRAFLMERVAVALYAGIKREGILLDPGFGFGKNLDHNLTLLARLDALASLGYPLLIGVSRKGFIGQVLGRAVHERLLGTAAAVALGVFQGARMVRVHDVAAMREVVRLVEAVRATARTARSTGH